MDVRTLIHLTILHDSVLSLLAIFRISPNHQISPWTTIVFNVHGNGPPPSCDCHWSSSNYQVIWWSSSSAIHCRCCLIHFVRAKCSVFLFFRLNSLIDSTVFWLEAKTGSNPHEWFGEFGLHRHWTGADGNELLGKKKHVVGLAYENLNKVDPHVWEYPNDV